jgi:hypothetical protein
LYRIRSMNSWSQVFLENALRQALPDILIQPKESQS